MYDTLLRRDPRDGQTIIPDLAQRWEISPDGKKYTFHLRKGVKFHDGADFTAEDVKATYDRIVRPPKGVVIPRTPLFATVGEIVVVDPHKIEFRLTEARPQAYMLGAFASGWNIIVRKKTLDDNQRQPAPGHELPGHRALPARLAARTRKSGSRSGTPTTGTRGCPTSTGWRSTTCRRSRRSSAPRSCPARSTTRGCSTRSRWRKAKEMPGVTAGVFNQCVIQAFWMNTEEEAARPIRRCAAPSTWPWTATRWSTS